MDDEESKGLLADAFLSFRHFIVGSDASTLSGVPVGFLRKVRSIPIQRLCEQQNKNNDKIKR